MLPRRERRLMGWPLETNKKRMGNFSEMHYHIVGDGLMFDGGAPFV